MKKIKLGLAILAAMMGAASVQAAVWTNGPSGDMKFSTASNWTNGTLPNASDVMGSVIGTTVANPALVDPAFSIGGTNGAFGNVTISRGSAGTAYVDVQSGATLKAINLTIGNANQPTYGGALTLKTGGTIIAQAGNSGSLGIGGSDTKPNGGPGLLTAEADANFKFSALFLGTNGTMKFMFGADSVSTFNSTRSSTGGTNTLNGLIQVDLGALTGSGTYTLINGVSNVLAGVLYTTLSGGSISSTGTYSSANFAVLNGGTKQWTLGLADSNRDVVLTVIPEPATFGMLGLGALCTLLFRRMRG